MSFLITMDQIIKFHIILGHRVLAGETRVNPRISINLKQSTKTRLDANRLPGQTYDGFMCLLLSR